MNEENTEAVQAEHTVIIRARHPATCSLIAKLKFGQPGDTIPDDELASVCGLRTGPGQPGYVYLMSAIRHVRKHHSIVWQRVVKCGCIKCLTAEERMATVDSLLKSATRVALRAHETSPMIDLVASKHRSRALAQVAQCYAVIGVAKAGTTEKLAKQNLTIYTPERLSLLFGGQK